MVCLDCDRDCKIRARGLCGSCYNRRKRLGQEMPPTARSFGAPIERVRDRTNTNGPIAPGMDTPCHLWTGATSKGYGVLNIRHRLHKTHRIVYEAIHGPTDLFVCHRCDVRNCVNPEHLFRGTVAENNADMVNKGRARKARGEKTSQAKLTSSDVLKARQLYNAGGITQGELAEQFGVSAATMSSAVMGRTWKHLPGAVVGRRGQMRGELAFGAVLTADDVREMRRLREEGETYAGLAEEFGVHLQTVASVITRRTWRHVLP